MYHGIITNRFDDMHERNDENEFCEKIHLFSIIRVVYDLKNVFFFLENR